MPTGVARGLRMYDPAYILRLLLSVITVSKKTLAITSALPRIHFEKEE
jgi:hypothetical protein